MNDFRSWRPIYGAMCPPPGPRDLFFVILINGKHVATKSADDHEKWRKAAERLAEEHKCHVKVLPMNGRELMNFLGIKPDAPKPMSEMDPAFRAQAVQNCLDVLLERGERRERNEALELLKQLGALHV